MLGGYASSRYAGRIGRGENPPPQFGHTLPSSPSTQSLQNVHSNVQIIALVASGGSGVAQFSQTGRSSSMPSSIRDQAGGRNDEQPTIPATLPRRYREPSVRARWARRRMSVLASSAGRNASSSSSASVTSVGVERESQHVHRWFEQLRCSTRRDDVEGFVRHDKLAVRAHDDGRIRQMTFEDALQGIAHRTQRGGVERGLGEDRRVAGGEQQVVALAQGELE